MHNKMHHYFKLLYLHLIIIGLINSPDLEKRSRMAMALVLWLLVLGINSVRAKFNSGGKITVKLIQQANINTCAVFRYAAECEGVISLSYYNECGIVSW